MQARIKKQLDGIDREILKVLYKNGPLNGRNLSLALNLSAPAISLRLNSLKGKGLVRIHSALAFRIFKRNFNGIPTKIKSSRGIYWEIDLID